MPNCPWTRYSSPNGHPSRWPPVTSSDGHISFWVDLLTVETPFISFTYADFVLNRDEKYQNSIPGRSNCCTLVLFWCSWWPAPAGADILQYHNNVKSGYTKQTTSLAANDAKINVLIESAALISLMVKKNVRESAGMHKSVPLKTVRCVSQPWRPVPAIWIINAKLCLYWLCNNNKLSNSVPN